MYLYCNLKSNLNYKLQPIDVNYKLLEFHCVIALQITIVIEIT